MERVWAGALGGISAVAVIVFQLLRAKLFAVVIGVEGTGVIAQVTALQSVLLAGAPLFSGSALLAALAAARVEGAAARDHTLQAARAIGLAVSTIAALIAALVIVTMMPGGIAAPLLFGILGVPFGALASVEVANLHQQRRFLALAVSSVVAGGLSLGIIAVLSAGYGVLGAAAGLSAGLFVVWFTSGSAGRSNPLRVSTDAAASRRTVRFGIGGLAGGVVAILGQAGFRAAAFVQLGASGAGIVYALVAVTAQLSSLATTIALTYGGPRIADAAARRDFAEIRRETAVMQAIALSAAGAAAILMALLSEIVMTTLFSVAFVAAAAYLPLQLAGEMFRVHSWVAGGYLLPLGYRRTFVLTESAVVATGLGLAVGLAPTFGVLGFSFAYASAALVGLVIVTLHSRSVIGLDARIPLALVLTAVIGCLAARHSPTISIIALALLGYIAIAGPVTLRRRRKAQ